jgi:hypothetical protein
VAVPTTARPARHPLERTFLLLIYRRSGGIGRRARLRALWDVVLWGFESPLRHQPCTHNHAIRRVDSNRGVDSCRRGEGLPAGLNWGVTAARRVAPSGGREPPYGERTCEQRFDVPPPTPTNPVRNVKLTNGRQFPPCTRISCQYRLRGPQSKNRQLGLTDGQASTIVDTMTVKLPKNIEEPEEALAAVGALRRLADRLEDAAVEKAIEEGWSWAQVAEALGVTRQAVHKKHARRL